jgi:hypothetical protein
MFASRSLTIHLLRGGLGIAALVLAATVATNHPVMALLLLPVAFVAFRGCPMCWTIGLFQTLAAKWRREAVTAACADGSCAIKSEVQRSTSAGASVGG